MIRVKVIDPGHATREVEVWERLGPAAHDSGDVVILAEPGDVVILAEPLRLVAIREEEPAPTVLRVELTAREWLGLLGGDAEDVDAAMAAKGWH